jgi:F-type H+-transporting ATPase subunit b
MNGLGQFWHTLEEISGQGLLGDLGIDLRTIILQIIVVIIMFKFVQMIFFKPLKQALDDRTKYLEDTYEEAEDLKSQMERMRSEYERKLAASEAESRARIQAAIAEAQSLKERIIGEARDQAKEIADRARTDMAHEREKMMLELRTHVVDLALSAAERVTRETMDDERHRRLVTAFVEETA